MQVLASEGPVVCERWIQALWPLQWSLISWAWGFCAMRSLLLGFRRRVGGLDDVIPPLGGVGASVWSVVVAKVQTH